MRTAFSIIAIVLGLVGVLVCAAAVGLGWWIAVKTAERTTRVAARLDQGLAEADSRLARTEERVNTARGEIEEVRSAAAKIAEENPELPRIRSAIEQLLGRLIPALDRVDAIADSLRSLTSGLRTTADIVDQLDGDPQTTARIRGVAEKLEGATDELDGLRAKVDEVKSAKAVVLTRKLVELARAAVAGSERLAEGLAVARREIANARERTAEWRDAVVFWTYLAAAANTLLWLWIGLGQASLVGWGRRRFSKAA